MFVADSASAQPPRDRGSWFVSVARPTSLPATNDEDVFGRRPGLVARGDVRPLASTTSRPTSEPLGGGFAYPLVTTRTYDRPARRADPDARAISTARARPAVRIGDRGARTTRVDRLARTRARASEPTRGLVPRDSDPRECRRKSTSLEHGVDTADFGRRPGCRRGAGSPLAKTSIRTFVLCAILASAGSSGPSTDAFLADVATKSRCRAPPTTSVAVSVCDGSRAEVRSRLRRSRSVLLTATTSLTRRRRRPR